MEKHKKREHEISNENKVEIEEIENEVGVIIQVNRPHVSIPDYSSYDNKTRLESADNSTYDDKSSIESAVTVPHNDNLRIETVEELEEINIKEKQKVKELEEEENTIKEIKIGQEEEYI